MNCGICKGGEIDCANPVDVILGCPAFARKAQMYACTSCGVLHDSKGSVPKNDIGEALVYKEGEVRRLSFGVKSEIAVIEHNGRKVFQLENVLFDGIYGGMFDGNYVLPAFGDVNILREGTVICSGVLDIVDSRTGIFDFVGLEHFASWVGHLYPDMFEVGDVVAMDLEYAIGKDGLIAGIRRFGPEVDEVVKIDSR